MTSSCEFSLSWQRDSLERHKVELTKLSLTYPFPMGIMNFPSAIIKCVKIPMSNPAEELRRVTINVTKNGIRSHGAA